MKKIVKSIVLLTTFLNAYDVMSASAVLVNDENNYSYPNLERLEGVKFEIGTRSSNNKTSKKVKKTVISSEKPSKMLETLRSSSKSLPKLRPENGLNIGLLGSAGTTFSTILPENNIYSENYYKNIKDAIEGDDSEMIFMDKNKEANKDYNQAILFLDLLNKKVFQNEENLNKNKKVFQNVINLWKDFFDHDEKTYWVNKKDATGQTLLMKLASNQTTHMAELLKMLLKVPNINLSLKDSHGKTALMYAAINHRNGMAFINLLAEEKCTILWTLLDTRDKFLQTALMHAVKSKNFLFAYALCQSNANVHLKNSDQNTAFSDGFLDILQLDSQQRDLYNNLKSRFYCAIPVVAESDPQILSLLC